MATIIKSAVEGSMIGCCGLAARNLNRAPNSLVESLKAPIGAFAGALLYNWVTEENVPLPTRVAKAGIPGMSAGLVAGMIDKGNDRYAAKDLAFVLGAGAVGQYIANRFIQGT